MESVLLALRVPVRAALATLVLCRILARLRLVALLRNAPVLWVMRAPLLRVLVPQDIISLTRPNLSESIHVASLTAVNLGFVMKWDTRVLLGLVCAMHGTLARRS